jgi:hypothetical protein
MIYILIIISAMIGMEGDLSGYIGPGIVDITGDITVPHQQTLQIRPGTVIRFSGFCGITVNGSIRIEGSTTLPVILTSANDSRYGGVDANPMDWNSITLSESAGECIFKFVEIAYSSDCIKSSAKLGCFEYLLLRNNGINRIVHGGKTYNAPSDGILNVSCAVKQVVPIIVKTQEKEVKQSVRTDKRNIRLYAALGIVAAGAAAGWYFHESDKNEPTEIPIIPDPSSPPQRP